MRYSAVVLFAAGALAFPLPLPQFSVSGPFGGFSWGGLGQGGEISGPLGSAATNGIFNGGGASFEGPLGSLSLGRDDKK